MQCRPCHAGREPLDLACLIDAELGMPSIDLKAVFKDAGFASIGDIRTGPHRYHPPEAW